MTSPGYVLERAFRVILNEASSNEGFAASLAEALNMAPSAATPGEGSRSAGRRHRRPAGLVNPIELVAHSEVALRDALASLNLEQLRDIVAEHGMDTRKLAMKWKERGRVEELIVTFAKDRVAKGSVFRTS